VKFAAVLAAGEVDVEEIAATLRCIVDGDFGGEQPGGSYFAYAFEAICRALRKPLGGSGNLPERRVSGDVGFGVHQQRRKVCGSWEARPFGHRRGRPHLIARRDGFVVEVHQHFDQDWNRFSVPIAQTEGGRSYETEIAEILEVLEAAQEKGRAFLSSTATEGD
jgi:hypothetical protein